jgi:antitoxin CptB
MGSDYGPRLNSKDAHYKKLQWRCRRGIKELDLLLQPFVSDHYLVLSESEKMLFEELLDYPDPFLYELLMGHCQSDNMEANYLAQKIRAAAHTRT